MLRTHKQTNKQTNSNILPTPTVTIVNYRLQPRALGKSNGTRNARE